MNLIGDCCVIICLFLSNAKDYKIDIKTYMTITISQNDLVYYHFYQMILLAKIMEAVYRKYFFLMTSRVFQSHGFEYNLLVGKWSFLWRFEGFDRYTTSNHLLVYLKLFLHKTFLSCAALHAVFGFLKFFALQPRATTNNDEQRRATGSWSRSQRLRLK